MAWLVLYLRAMFLFNLSYHGHILSQVIENMVRKNDPYFVVTLFISAVKLRQDEKLMKEESLKEKDRKRKREKYAEKVVSSVIVSFFLHFLPCVFHTFSCWAYMEYV